MLSYFTDSSNVTVNASTIQELTTNLSSDFLSWSNESDTNKTAQWSFFLHEPIYRNIFIACCVFIASLCIGGNLLVLVVLLRNRRMHRLTNLFLSNLALADLFVGIFCVIPFTFQYVHLYWILGQAMCKLWKFIETTSLTVSMLSLQVIALERYIAINHPLKAKRLFTQCKMYIAVLLVWFFAAAYSTPLLLVFDTYNIYEKGKRKTFCHYQYNRKQVLDVYKLMNFIVWYSLPLLIMVVLYIKIGLTVKRSQVAHEGMHRRPRSTVQTRRQRLGSGRKSSNTDIIRGEKGASVLLTSGPGQTQDCEPTQTVVSGMRLWWRKKEMEHPSKANQPATGNGKTRCYEDPEKCFNDRHSPMSSKTPRTSKLPQTFSFKNEYSKNHKVFGCIERDRVRGHLAAQHSGSSTSSTPADSLEEANVHWQRVPAKRSAMTIVKSPGETSGSAQSEDEVHADMGPRENGLNRSYSVPAISSGSGVVRRCRLTTTQSSSRRRVSRLLVAIVLAFASLVLPYHVRNLMDLAKVGYESSNDLILVTIVSILSLYMNSAVNPILYSFISQTFHRRLRESVCCSCRTECFPCKNAGSRPRDEPYA